MCRWRRRRKLPHISERSLYLRRRFNKAWQLVSLRFRFILALRHASERARLLKLVGTSQRIGRLQRSQRQ